MVDKCKVCGSKFVRYPLRDDGGKIIWKNLFKMDWQSILLIIIIFFMVWSYKHDIAQCEEMIEEPYSYCEKTNCCEIIKQQDQIIEGSDNWLSDEKVRGGG
jgi:hypothetical protein